MTTRCSWSSTRPCQFQTYGYPTVEHEGKQYCPLHAPLEANGKSLHTMLPQLEQVLRDSDAPLIGVKFPQNGAIALSTHHPTVTFVNCVFANGAIMQLYDSACGAVLEDCTFEGDFLVYLRPRAKFVADAALFPGKLTISNLPQHVYEVSLRKARFLGGLKISVPLEGEWDFAYATFHSAVTIPTGSERRIAQAASFIGAKFRGRACHADHEAQYRELRQAFESNGDRDNEGVFFQAEKRSQRRNLPLGITRAVSALYVCFSGYGSSYIKPMSWFILLQVVFGFAYSIQSGRLGAALHPDWAVWAFTLAQVAKPFELLSARQAKGVFETVIGSTSAPGWAVATFTHSLLSVLLLALFVLALRWRFKRN